MTFGTRVLVSWVLATLAACAHAGDRAPAPAGPTSETERGAAVQFEPVDLQVALQVRGSRTGELRHGDLVQSGDRIQLTIRTREDSHVYLAYCSTKGSLAWFPDQGSIVARAGVPIIAPAARASIVMDDNPGPESLYVVLSQRELSLSDAELSSFLEAARAGGSTKDCERPFASQRNRPPKRSAAPSRKNAGDASAVGVLPYVAEPKDSGAAPEDPPPRVELIRGGFIAWDDPQQVTARVDASGIAILRYAFTHVARVP